MKLQEIQNYTVTEARNRLSIGKTKFYELMKSGELRYLTIGSVRRIPHAELARFQEARLHAA